MAVAGWAVWPYVVGEDVVIRYDPRDMAATIYHLLGVDPATVIRDPSGRPQQLVLGKPIEGILT